MYALCIAEAQQATHFLLSARSSAGIFSIAQMTRPAMTANSKVFFKLWRRAVPKRYLSDCSSLGFRSIQLRRRFRFMRRAY